MITRIELENFKGSRASVVIDLSPLTFLFGPNSAGKSTVIQALHYAFEVLLKGNLNAGTTTRGGAAIDLGGFHSLVHEHDLGRAIRVRLDFTIDGDLLDYVTAEPIERQPVPPDDRLLLRPRSSAGRPGAVGGLRQRAVVAVQSPLFDDVPKREEDLAPRLSASFAEYVSQRARRAAVEFRVRWSAARSEPVVDRYRVRLNGKPMGCIEASADGRGARITTLNVDHPVFQDKQLALLDDAVSPLAAVVDWHAVLTKGGGIPVGGTEGALPLRASRVRFDMPEDAGPGWRRVAGVLRLVLLGPLEVLREHLEGIRYVGPLRDVPQRHYDVAPSADEGRWATGLAAWDALQRNAELRRTVSTWMSEDKHLGSGYGLRVRRFMELPTSTRNRYVHGPTGAGRGDGTGDGRGLGSGEGDGDGSGSGGGARAGAGAGDGTGSGAGKGGDDDIASALARAPQREKLVLVQFASAHKTGGLEVLPEDVGVGISQLVPVIAAAFDRQVTALDGRRVPVSLVAIEQPELHVHPAIQVGIGDLLIAASKTRQLLIETHSEHLILRVQRRLRETHAGELADDTVRVTPGDVAVVYLDRTKEGTLSAAVLRLDDEGRFKDPWPKGFFDERMKELF